MNNKLAYLITKSSMFGACLFLLIRENGKNAYLSLLLGTLFGFIILFLYSLIKKNLKEKNLFEVLKKYKLGKLYIFLFILFYILLITIILLNLTIFVNSFYLVNTPKVLIILPFILISLYLAYKDDYVLESLSNFIFYFTLLIVVIYALVLIPYYNYSEILPLFNYKINGILKGSLTYASITTIPQILIIDHYKDFNNIYLHYIIASFINLLIILGIIFALGNTLINVYSFPEYDVLKQIKLLDFIENIESLSTFGWYSELFIMLSTIISNLKKAVPKKGNLLYIIIILAITIYLSAFIVGGNYALTLKLFYLYPYILIVFLLIFITIILYLKNKNNNNCIII